MGVLRLPDLCRFSVIGGFMSVTSQHGEAVAAAGLKIGPMRWDGDRLVTEVAKGSNGRIYDLDPEEARVLRALSAPGDMAAVRRRLGYDVSMDLVEAEAEEVIDDLLLCGLIEEPAGSSAMVQEHDDAHPLGPRSFLDEEPASIAQILDSLAEGMWRMASLTPLWITAVVAVGVGAFFVPVATIAQWDQLVAVARGAMAQPPLMIMMVVVGVVAWHLLSRIGHEFSHGAAFVRLTGGRRPILVHKSPDTWIRPVVILDGLGLLAPPWRPVAVVLAGPLFTLAAVCVPLTAALHGPGLLSAWGALAVLVELTTVILCLIPFPNTDGTHVLEVLSATSHLPVAAVQAWRGVPLAEELPLVTRLAVRYYAVFLMVALVIALVWSWVLLGILI